MKIFLKDFKEAVREEFEKRNTAGYSYSNELFEQAFKSEVELNLNYNIRTGKAYNDYFGICAEYSFKKDIPKYDSLEEAAKWELTGKVRNAASKISRGYLKA